MNEIWGENLKFDIEWIVGGLLRLFSNVFWSFLTFFFGTEFLLGQPNGTIEKLAVLVLLS